MSESNRQPLIRRILRFLFITVSCLLAVASVLAIAAWRKSSTPLTRVEPTANAAVDLEAFRRGEYVFPGETWSAVEPALVGWDTEALNRAHRFTRSLDTSSLIVLHRGVPVALWGEISRRENSQSIRKALLGGLYGSAVKDGIIGLDTNLGDLGVDDDPPLTSEEKTATVRHLLLARSGVYHSAIYETGWWKRNKPDRSSAAPGQEWYYNNWGFNALSTIYERATGESLGDAFDQKIAQPIGMEDFRPRDVVYLRRDDMAEKIQGNESDHPAYIFMISARDLARFGLLYLTDGRWEGRRQVLPAGWALESTFGSAMATTWGDRRYGYLWWVDPPREALPYESFVASGGRGHKLTVIPALDLVIVHRIPTGSSSLPAQLFRRFVWHPAVEDRDHDRMVELVLQAYPNLPQPSAGLMPGEADPESSTLAAGAADDTQPEPAPSSS
jgi:CubicO group peptidase (beta-lactamase class C family)